MMTANMRKRYEASLCRHFAFVELNAFVEPSDDVDLDGSVAKCIDHLWEEGDPRYWAEDTLSGTRYNIVEPVTITDIKTPSK